MVETKQITIDAFAQKRGGLTTIYAETDNRVVTSAIASTKVDTTEKVVRWIIAQPTTEKLEATDVQRRITATLVKLQNPENGMAYWDLQSIDAVQLIPRDDGRAGIEGLPGWATWTAQEASDWIDATVVDLDTAKIAMENMAKMLIYLRKMTAGE